MTRFTLAITATRRNRRAWARQQCGVGCSGSADRDRALEAVAPTEHRAAFIWVVTRHEIDYRGNVAAGETVRAETWVDTRAGAAVRRKVRFLAPTGA